MYIVIHLDIKISIPFCNSCGEVYLGFCRQFMISFNMLLKMFLDKILTMTEKVNLYIDILNLGIVLLPA